MIQIELLCFHCDNLSAFKRRLFFTGAKFQVQVLRIYRDCDLPHTWFPPRAVTFGPTTFCLHGSAQVNPRRCSSVGRVSYKVPSLVQICRTDVGLNHERDVFHLSLSLQKEATVAGKIVAKNPSHVICGRTQLSERGMGEKRVNTKGTHFKLSVLSFQ